MKEKLTKLLELKSIITLLLVCFACYGFMVEKITPELFATWVGMVLVFYFTRKQPDTKK